MATPEEIQTHVNVDEFLKKLLPAKIIESQSNANILTSYLLSNGQTLSVENMLAAVRGPLLNALQWETKPTSADEIVLPEVPEFMEHIRSKADLAVLMRDGNKYQQWMRGKAGPKFSARVTYILQNDITE